MNTGRLIERYRKLPIYQTVHLGFSKIVEKFVVKYVPMYSKCSKISNTLIHTFWPKFCFLCSGFFKYLVEWQTVQTLIRLLLQEQSNLGLHCLHMPHCQTLWCTKFKDFHYRTCTKGTLKKKDQ